MTMVVYRGSGTLIDYTRSHFSHRTQTGISTRCIHDRYFCTRRFTAYLLKYTTNICNECSSQYVCSLVQKYLRHKNSGKSLSLESNQIIIKIEIKIADSTCPLMYGQFAVCSLYTFVQFPFLILLPRLDHS